MNEKTEPIKVALENRIKVIRSMATKLKTIDIISCEDQLRKLRSVIHDVEYWLDSYTREIKDENLKQKVRQLAATGIEFDSVVVDGVKFCLKDKEKIVKVYEKPELPF